MAAPFMLTFLVLGSAVQVGLRAADGTVAPESFENSEAGVRSLERWLAGRVVEKDAAHGHSCVATTGAQNDAFFNSPFFAFAYDATDNTSVWSKDRLAEAMEGAAASAAAMLSACAREHSVA